MSRLSSKFGSVVFLVFLVSLIIQTTECYDWQFRDSKFIYRDPEFIDNPPHPRPPAEPDYYCPVSEKIQRYKPQPNLELEGSLICPQSETTTGFVELWLKGFADFHPNVNISVPILGSGIAGPCLAAQDCDCAIIGREILNKELAFFLNAFGYPPLEVPCAAGSFRSLAFTDGEVFFVNADNPLYELSFPIIDAIYSQTRKRGFPVDLTKWGDVFRAAGLRPGSWTKDWDTADINLYGVKPENGFELFINRTVLLNGLWKDSIITRDTVFEMSQLVSNDRYGFGYSGFAFLKPTDKIKLLSLSSSLKGTFYEGNATTICSREYPLSRLQYIYLNKPPGQHIDPILNEFLRYILSYEGQLAVEVDRIFFPLTPVFIEEQLVKLNPTDL